jgi:hypothetical protein
VKSDCRMTFPQSTLEEVIESELQMVLKANDRFGKYWTTARESSIFLSRCIASFDHDRMHFGRFVAILKKHHMLAILSAVRLHKSQAMMNLRQAIEAGASAAFALANPEDKHFFEWENGLIQLPKKLPGKRYDWLDKNHKALSDVIKAKKDLINGSQAHANVVASHSIFRVDGDQANLPFFDIEDAYQVQTDLWLAAAVALDVMKLLREVNTGRNVIEFIDGFDEHLVILEMRTAVLLEEMKATERYQKAEAARLVAEAVSS